MNELHIGQLVISTAGHDKDKKFIVLSIINEQYVYISDGYIRKVNHPKKKKIKHLKGQMYSSEVISSKLQLKQKLTDSEIRQYIKSVDQIEQSLLSNRY